MGSRVVRVYSPNATWPAVRTALRGASVVVYLGHGNGWPSRYRDSAWPYSQNGLGLNPVAGLNDDEHQYFGEFYLSRDIRLAPGAVVVMSRLCYASGNSEPGLPEGTLDVARQRVDNYAAGWIRAGARSVIADAFTSPAYYVRALLASRQRVDSIWRGSPNDHGNQLTFQSTRSPGHLVELDPDRRTSGFHRSLVDRSSTAHARGVPAAPAEPGPSYSARDQTALGTTSGGLSAPATVRQPTLAEAGFRFGAPTLARPPTAGRPVSLFVPVTLPAGRQLPPNMTGAVRWDPLELAAPRTAPVPLGPADDATAGTSGDAPPKSGSASRASVLGPIVPEVVGEVVLTQLVQPARGGVTVPLGVPSVPGLYRLTVLLANNQGQALSGGKEPLIAPQLVRVTSPLAATFRVKNDVSAPAGANVALPITVANSGSVSWSPEPAAASADRGSRPTPATARVTAHWVGLDEALNQTAVPVTSASVAVGSLAPGQSTSVVLRLRTPDVGGQYALVLDIVTPGDGSIVAAGADPGLVRVTIRPPAGSPSGTAEEGSLLP
jgi:hypothetical protein